MYRIAEVETIYSPTNRSYWDAEKEVTEYANKLAKSKGFTAFAVRSTKVYGRNWNISIYCND